MTEQIDIKKLTAEEIYRYFEKANILCQDLIVYDEETDGNKLLGRPGAYTSKVNFNDSHIPSKSDPPCTVEVFRNHEDAVKRQAYIESVIEKYSHMLHNQYFFLRENVLVRFPYALSPTLANKYDAVLVDLMNGVDPTDKFEVEVLDPSTVTEYKTKLEAMSEAQQYVTTISFGDKDESKSSSGVKIVHTGKVVINAKKKDEPTEDEPVEEDKSAISDEKEVYLAPFTSGYTFGELKYYVPGGWIFKDGKRGHYHYALEEGSLDGGYMYFAKMSASSRVLKSFQGMKAGSQFREIAEDMASNKGAPIVPRSDFEDALILQCRAVYYLADAKLGGKTYPTAIIIMGGEEYIYTFTFILEDYTDDMYRDFLEKFIKKIEPAPKSEGGGFFKKIFK